MTIVVHVIDDDEAVRDSLAFLLESAGMAVRTYEFAPRLPRRSSRAESGLHHHRRPHAGHERHRPAAARQGAEGTIPVIVITGHGDVPLAVEAMKLGAVDFLEKPFDDEA